MWLVLHSSLTLCGLANSLPSTDGIPQIGTVETQTRLVTMPDIFQGLCYSSVFSLVPCLLESDVAPKIHMLMTFGCGALWKQLGPQDRALINEIVIFPPALPTYN